MYIAHVSKKGSICKKLLLDRIEHFHTVFTQVTIAPVLSTHRQRWTHYIVHVEHGTEPFSRLLPRWDDFHHVAPRKKRWTEPNVDIKASASNLQDGRSKLLIDSEIHLCSLQKRQMILCKKQKTGSYSKLIECSIFVLSSMFGFSLVLCQSSSLSLHIQLRPFRLGPPDAVSCSGVIPLANVECSVGCKTRYNQMIEQPTPPKTNMDTQNACLEKAL